MEKYEKMVTNRRVWSVIGITFNDLSDYNLGNQDT